MFALPGALLGLVRLLCHQSVLDPTSVSGSFIQAPQTHERLADASLTRWTRGPVSLRRILPAAREGRQTSTGLVDGTARSCRPSRWSVIAVVRAQVTRREWLVRSSPQVDGIGFHRSRGSPCGLQSNGRANGPGAADRASYAWWRDGNRPSAAARRQKRVVDDRSGRLRRGLSARRRDRWRDRHPARWSLDPVLPHRDV